MTDPKKILKSIVKECLIEILSEGIGGNASQSVGSLAMSSLNSLKENTVAKKMPVKKSKSNSANNIDRILDAATDDSMMRSILAETAKTTYVEQMKHESKFNRGETTMVDVEDSAGIDIDSIFKGAKNSWSAMAFLDKK